MENTRTIIDSYRDVYVESLDLRDVCSTPNGKIPFRVAKRRLRGGVQDGVDVVEIDAGKFSFVVLLSRGMNIWKARCGDVELKWDSPVRGPVHPRFVPIFAPNGCGWLEGFDEWVARCGLESNGAPEFDENGVLRYPLHGRISNLPARRVQVTVDPETGMIRLTGEVLETSVFGRRFKLTVSYTTWAGSSTLVVEDSVANLASVDDEFELLYHINTGYPLVTPGAKFVAPFRRMCPRDENAVAELDAWDAFREPIPGCAETCYLFDLAAEENGDTSVALLNAERNRGLSLSFNKNDFPYFTLWKTQRPNGDIYVSGIEPSVNFPNRRSFEKKQGRVVPLGAGETKNFRFQFDVLGDAAAIEERVRYIERLQGTTPGEIASAPIPEWCE
ncbi:MAG: aldose 1-epimerase family protein [Thermoguttaceae bacterium]|nr:aldose 1-epimerase family protein [Thermoguttaceae bacterium]